jgi:hypothetical protein
MKFLAEVKSTKQLKKASLDQEYTVVLITEDSSVLDLGKLPYETVVEVKVEVKK